MTNEIVPVVTQDQADDASVTNRYLAILTIPNTNTKKLLEPEFAYAAKFIGQICILDGGVYVPGGNEVAAVYLGQRRKATRYKAGEYSSVLMDVHTNADPVKYADWRARAKRYEQGYKFGLEFLMYLPDFGKFATLFHGTDFEKKVGSTHILNGVKEEHTRFTLFTKATPASSKFPRTVIAAKADDFDVDAPDEEETKDAIEKFYSPPSFVDDPGDER